MGRLFRYLAMMYRIGKSKTKLTPGEYEYIWLKAYFTDARDIEYINFLVREIDAVVKALNPKRGMTWYRLWRFKSYDRNLFLGADLLTAPTRSVLCMMYHFGDISDNVLINRWDWAIARDLRLLDRKVIVSRHTKNVSLMRDTIKLTNVWVNKRKRQCEQNNSMQTPMASAQES